MPQPRIHPTDTPVDEPFAIPAFSGDKNQTPSTTAHPATTDMPRVAKTISLDDIPPPTAEAAQIGRVSKSSANIKRERRTSLPRLVSLESSEKYHFKDPKDFYDFGDVLGQGAFATVFSCTSKIDGSEWACKIIDKTKMKEKDLKGLKLEMETMASVDHDNIVKLKEIYDTKEALHLILELCHGGELFDRIVQLEAYNEDQAGEAFSQMVEAMGHCHRLNIVHRDLKPENLIYRGALPDIVLKLADFGLAQQVSPEDLLDGKSGTPGYIAPEMLKGMLYGKPVDMWALGVILYILLCGFPPFYEENMEDLFDVIKKGEYEFHEPYWDDVSDEAKDLITNLLVVDPEKRYTVQQAKDHPWMKAVYEKSPALLNLLPHFQGNLRKYNTRRRFKGIVYGVMVTSIMKTFTKKTKAKVMKSKAAKAEAERKKLLASQGAPTLHDENSRLEDTFDPAVAEISVITTPWSHLPDQIPLDLAKELAGAKFDESKMSPDGTLPKVELFHMVAPTREEQEASGKADMEKADSIGLDAQAILSAVRWDRPLAEIKRTISSRLHVHCVDESTGNYPLHVAAQNGHLDLVRWLVSAGAKVNVQNGTGQTPLHMAKGYDIYETAAFLLEYGANPELKNWAGHPAKFGIEGDKDPRDPVYMLEYAEETPEAHVALDLLRKMAEVNPASLEKLSLAKLGLAVKRGLKGLDKDEWTEECHAKFVAILQLLN
jgi:calcium/calmodulin-dependent protein kinase I